MLPLKVMFGVVWLLMCFATLVGSYTIAAILSIGVVITLCTKLILQVLQAKEEQKDD